MAHHPTHRSTSPTPIRTKSGRLQWKRYWILLLLPLVAVIGWFGGQPLTITLIFGAVWATYAVGFDLFSGYSGRVNLGYAMFPGTAAYVSAAINVHLGWSPWMSVPIGALAAILLAVVIGWLSLRITGIYFALSTSIVPLALFQLTHIFGEVVGGEEGIWGVEPFFLDPRLDLIAMLVILGAALLLSLWFVHAKPGLVLRAIKGGETTTQALGIRPFRFLMAGFILSAAIGGMAGAYLAHFQMFIGPEILYIVTTLQVITFAQVGGPATIVGPALGGFLLVLLNEYLRAWADVRLFAYFVALVLLLRFSPQGLIVPVGKAIDGLVRGWRRAEVQS